MCDVPHARLLRWFVMTPRRALVTVAVAIVIGLTAEGAQAAAVPAAITPIAATEPTAMAIAGDELLWASPNADGYLLRAAPITGVGTPVQRRAVVPDAQSLKVSVVALDASETQVALVEEIATATGTWRALFGGPPSGPLDLLAGPVEVGAGWAPEWVGVSGDRIAVLENRGSIGKLRLRLFAPGAAPRQLAKGSLYAAAGPTGVAWASEEGVVIDDLVGLRRVVQVTNRPDVDDLDLRADGTVVLKRDDDLLQIRPGAPRASLIAANAVRTDPGFTTVGTGAVLFSDDARGSHAGVPPQNLRVIDSKGRRRTLGPVSTGLITYVADGDRFAFATAGCLVVGPLNARSAVGLPEGPCARSQAVFEPITTSLRRDASSLRLGARCVSGPPDGCVGTVTLLGRDGRRIASARFTAGVGARANVLVALTPEERVALRKAMGKRGAALGAEVTATDPAGRTATTEASYVLTYR